MRKFTSLILVLAFMLTGCAGAYKNTYVTGATVKTFVTESHSEYDERVQAKLDECDPERNPDSPVKTKTDFDECMTKPFSVKTQEAIVAALAIYKAVATAFSAVMLGCEPNEDGTPVKAATCAKRTFTDAELREWRGKIIDAAIEALRQFPDAEDKINNLTKLVGK